MNDGGILEKVRQLLVDVLSVERSEIDASARIMDDLGAESIDLLDLRFRIERSFGFKISDEELARAFGDNVTKEEFQNLFTVGALCEYVTKRLENNA